MSLQQFFSRIASGLLQEKVPLWLHVATLIATIVVTILVAPVINAKFEQQKIKSAFVIDSLNSINNLTGDLAVNITTYNYCELNRPRRCDAEIKITQGAIVRLQWKALQLRAILTSPADRAAIKRFQSALDDVGTALNSQPSSVKTTRLDTSAKAFGLASVDLVRRVAKQAGIAT